MSSLTANFRLPEFYPSYKPIEGEPQLPIGQEFRIVGLAEEMRESPNTFFLNYEFLGKLEMEDGQLLRSSLFTSREDWAIGREESSQQVFFGEMTLVVDEGSSGREVSQPVAFKPYHVALRPAVHEYASFNFINTSGIIETFHPIGFWVDSEGKVFLMTEFEEDVKTLDNVDWAKTEQDPLREHFEPFDALTKSAQTLARLHAAGVSHGDAQIKNMAIDLSGLRLVDLTNLRRFLEDSEDTTVSLIQDPIQRDLRKLTTSISNFRYLETSDSKSRRQIVEANLLAPYRSIMRHPSSALVAGNVAVHEAIDAVAESVLEAL